MEDTQAASVETPDPSQATVPVVGNVPNETQDAAADMAAALKAFRSATGAPEKPAEAPVAPQPSAAPSEKPAAPEAPQAPQSADLTAILARMQRFEDERASSASKIQELEAQLAERDAKLTVKDPIAFLKERGFSKEQVEDWLLNGGKSEVAQKSEMDLLKERIARFEAAETERAQRSEADKAEAKRAAAEAHYKTNTIGKALDATKYPLLHLAHTPDEITAMAYAQAVARFQATKQEPDINEVLGGMEKVLVGLRDKLSPKSAPRTAAPSLSELASHSEAGTRGTEAEDDTSALAAASALAKQFLSK